MRIVSLFAFTLLTLSAAVPAAAENNAANTIAWSEITEAWNVVQQEQRPMLLYVTMDGCTYCDLMKKKTYTDPNVISEINTYFVAASANRTQRPDLVKKLGVRTFPTTIVISPKREVLGVMTGFVSSAEFQSKLTAIRAHRVAAAK